MINRLGYNSAFLCLTLAVCFLHWPDIMADLCAAALGIRALRWAFFGR
jgi:hypothetical protein